MIELLVILSLIGLNVFQHVYWSRQNQKLVDKLMSRNYHEYVQAQPQPSALKMVAEPEDPDDLRPLQGFQL